MRIATAVVSLALTIVSKLHAQFYTASVSVSGEQATEFLGTVAMQCSVRTAPVISVYGLPKIEHLVVHGPIGGMLVDGRPSPPPPSAIAYLASVTTSRGQNPDTNSVAAVTIDSVTRGLVFGLITVRSTPTADRYTIALYFAARETGEVSSVDECSTQARSLRLRRKGWSLQAVSAVVSGRVIPDMSAEQVRESRGEPIHVTRGTSKGLVSEVWEYGQGYVVTLQNDRVASVVEKKR